MAVEVPKKNIVIVGGGIIGSTTAYFLTRHPSYSPQTHKITILEATSIAAGASGKAGGLLALWAYPACIVPLSYQLHRELAREHDGAKRWGYRAVHCASVECKGRVREQKKKKEVGEAGFGGMGVEGWNKLPKTNGGEKVKGRAGGQGDVPADLDWIDRDAVKEYSVMGTPDTTAQVHPYQFTTSMADLAIEAGAEVVLGKVTDVNYDEAVKSVTYTDKATKESKTIPATDVIISAGPWTSQVFPSAPIDAMRAHSVVIQAEVAPYAIFSEISLSKDFNRTGGQGVQRRRHGLSVSPEMYARPDGTVYACGEGDSLVPLPDTADQVVVDQDRCQDIIDYVGSISTPLHEGEVTARQACYLPSVRTGGGPLIGATGIKGLFMATGHTCWGIQNSCATGKIMSEFVFEGRAKSANVGSLDPRRVL